MVPIFIMFLALFTSGIQVFIFATIAAIYVGESMEGHHSLSFEIVYFSLVQGGFMPCSR
jgi:F-type H+-transporting ATPase subunit a